MRLLHLVDADIYRALCGVTLSRVGGDPRGQWWWHDERQAATRLDVPPGVEAVAARDGLTVCPACAEHEANVAHDVAAK